MSSTASPQTTSNHAAAYKQKLEIRRAGLQDKLRARKGKTAYVANCVELEAEIAKLDRVLTSLKDPAIISEG